MKAKHIALVALMVTALTAQQQEKPKIKSITVGPSEPPLRPATCTESGYGYLHVGGRTDLTAKEIGEYVIADSKDGKILKIYPPRKGGIFVYAECQHPASKVSR